MIYQIDRIIRDVRVCLNENQADTALLVEGDEETLRLNDIIKSKILEAVKAVHSEAPYWKIKQGFNFGYDDNGIDDDDNGIVDDEEAGIYWGGEDDTWGWIVLPDDFMRLVVFEMSDWERPVYEAITPADPRYSRQRSRFKGIRGTAQRPVAALVVRAEGKVLEFYSCKSQAAHISQAAYVPYPMIDNGGVDISEACYTAVIYMIAGLTLMTEGETEKANVYIEKAKTETYR